MNALLKRRVAQVGDEPAASNRRLRSESSDDDYGHAGFDVAEDPVRQRWVHAGGKSRDRYQ
jgi:hypothetical protein